MDATARRGQDRSGNGWLLLAVAAMASLVVHLVAIGIAVAFGPRGMNLVMLPGGALASWWFHRGAWLRTSWGRPAPDVEAPWTEPALTSGRARLATWLAAMCVAGAAVALLVQIDL